MESQIKFFNSDSISCIVGEFGCLGRGSYGVVRCGFHPIHELIAVKCSAVQGKTRSRSVLEKRIKTETDLLQKANHENVVRVYGWTQWSQVIAIIMEYLPVGNLMEVLEDHGESIKPLLCLRMCYEISNGIAFIHNLSSEKILVHGDVKAENILLTIDLHCKISDFGGARLSTYTGRSKRTNNNQFKKQYTVLYAAPEVIENPTIKLKPEHDTYSFAITVFVILNRDIPIPDAFIIMYLEGVKRGQRPHLDNIKDLLDNLKQNGRNDEVKVIDSLIKVMKDCWHQDPPTRPLMLDVRDRLKKILSDCDPVVIQQIAVDATRQMDIHMPSRDQYTCVPLDQLSPFDLYHNLDFATTKDRSLSVSSFTSKTETTKFSHSTSADAYACSDAAPCTSASRCSLESEPDCSATKDRSLSVSSSTSKAETTKFTHSTSADAYACSDAAPCTSASGSCLESEPGGADSCKLEPSSPTSLDEVACTVSPQSDLESGPSLESNPKVSDSDDLIQTIVQSIKTLLEKQINKNAIHQSGQTESESASGEITDWKEVITNIIKIVTISEENSDFTKATSMVRWAVELCNNIDDVKVRLEKLKTCGTAVFKLAESMNHAGKQAEIEQLCLTLLQEIHKTVELLPTIDLKLQTVTKVNFQCQIAMCYSFIGNHKQAEEICTSEIQNICSSLGEEANKCIVLAFCYFLNATANKETGNYRTAVEQYKKSIKVCQSAEDVQETERKQQIEIAKDFLKEAQAFCPSI